MMSPQCPIEARGGDKLTYLTQALANKLPGKTSQAETRGLPGLTGERLVRRVHSATPANDDQALRAVFRLDHVMPDQQNHRL